MYREFNRFPVLHVYMFRINLRNFRVNNAKFAVFTKWVLYMNSHILKTPLEELSFWSS